MHCKYPPKNVGQVYQSYPESPALELHNVNIPLSKFLLIHDKNK